MILDHPFPSEKQLGDVGEGSFEEFRLGNRWQRHLLEGWKCLSETALSRVMSPTKHEVRFFFYG